MDRTELAIALAVTAITATGTLAWLAWGTPGVAACAAAWTLVSIFLANFPPFRRWLDWR